jgi:hypothetical protein|tara:strand:+ start:68 stop:493 length:426 start_codon:yes stop_codon:yes gene_type:complete
MLKKLTNLQEVIELVKNDPVRPNIDPQWRITPPREVYYLEGPRLHYTAACCMAFTNSIPISEMDLIGRIHTGNIAVFYTVWSKEKGMGRKILFEVLDIMKERNYTKFITLSPKTEMAKRFHFSNGAILLQENHESYNFEYK